MVRESDMRLTLVIPCYNEAQNLPALVERCLPLIEDARIDVILVDNASTDATAEVMPALIDGVARLTSVRVTPNRGYGGGILAGLGVATGDVLAWTHADLQTNPFDARAAFAQFEQAGTTRLFVKGRRSGRPLVDIVFTAGMSLFETILTGRPMRDINAQPTMFGRALFEAWRDPPADFALDLYAYWTAKQLDWPVRRIPVVFGPRLFGTSHWNTGLFARLKFIRRTLDFSLRLKRRGLAAADA
jgi:glycosyltransferase involved in cell wall biosynthesis